MEPLHAYVWRKYLALFLALLPLVAAGAVDVALFGGSEPPPLWAVAYANLLAILLPAALLIAFRKRLERRRFRIDDKSVAFPSLVRIDESSLDAVPLSSVIWIRNVKGEIGILGYSAETIVRAEIGIRHESEELVLVWPIEAFGRKNYEALLRALSSATGAR